MSTVPAETPEAAQAPVHTEAPAAAEAPATIDTYVDKRRSYCESCDTFKKGVQWWTTEFRPTNQERNVMSACKSCVQHVPQRQCDMKPAW